MPLRSTTHINSLCLVCMYRWFDLVVVLQCGTSVLWERLEKRRYPPSKISENVECEIMMVILEEATESYRWVGKMMLSLVST